MSQDPSVDELLAAWEEAHGGGQLLTAEELCVTCPELLEPLRRRIQMLRAIAPVLDLTPYQEAKELAETPAPISDTRVADAAQGSRPPTIGHIPGYERLEEIGRGGVAVVYKAWQPALDRHVAIKMILAGQSAGDTTRARFQSEAKTVARLKHPHIVEIYDTGTYDDRPFFVLELVEGGNLETFTKDRRLPATQVARLIETLARTIHFAHLHGVIHRDLKPANILLQGAGVRPNGKVDLGTPKITDFGLARQIGVERRLTTTGAIMGTPYYMAPEQATGQNDTIGPATDIYSLGVILYELLTGAVPFDGNTEWEVLHKVVHDAPDPPRVRQPDCPTALEAICLSCLQKKPYERYGGAEALADDLARFLAGDAISPPAHLAATIKVGILFSLAGPMAINTQPVVDVIQWAIKDLNQQGFLPGKTICPVIADAMFDMKIGLRETERLIVDEGVVTLFGGWTSAGRKTGLPVLEKHQHLLLFPVEFEGLERSNHVVYLGAAPNQLILPAIRWAREELGRRRFFLVGTDSVFSRAVNAIVRDELQAQSDAQCVGEMYATFGQSRLDRMVDQIKSTRPDVIFNVITGDKNIAFFRALHEVGITSRTMPVLSVNFTEQELRSLLPVNMAGHYIVSSYFMSVDRPENHRFLERLHTALGRHRVTTDAMEAAYVGVHLWAQAVRECASDDPQAIRSALVHQRFDGPGGPIRIDPDTGYAHKFARIGHIEADGTIPVVWSSPEPIAPQPFPATRTPDEWQSFLQQLYRGWGNRWANVPT